LELLKRIRYLMATSDKKYNRVSRRGFLGTGLMLPFLPVTQTPLLAGNQEKKETQDKEDDEYTTMLTSAGGVVRVKKSTLKEAKVISSKMSNKSLLSWLKFKDKG
tara:strand:+ start:309 stop:623 length:315 start_codon:yes stop_codon:yes gene_type:complete